MFRWIIDDTRALLEDVRRLLSRLGTRWQWFRLRSRRRLDNASAELENVRRGVEVPTRMCRECRALIPSKARQCPECGEWPGGKVSRGFGRLLENMIPGVASISTGILTANFVLYALSLLVWSSLESGLPPPARAGAWNITLACLGGNVPVLVAAGEYWRLLSSVFLHGGAIHLLFNSWALFAVGPLVEEIYGPRKFVFFFVVTGTGAALVSALWRSGSFGPSIGASGALFGLIGLAAVWGGRHGGSVGQGIRGQMVQWVIYGLVMGFLIPGVDNAAHIGGMLVGATLALVVTDRRGLPSPDAMFWEIVAWVCGLAIVGSFILVALRYPTTLAFYNSLF